VINCVMYLILIIIVTIDFKNANGQNEMYLVKTRQNKTHLIKSEAKNKIKTQQENRSRNVSDYSYGSIWDWLHGRIHLTTLRPMTKTTEAITEQIPVKKISAVKSSRQMISIDKMTTENIIAETILTQEITPEQTKITTEKTTAKPKRRNRCRQTSECDCGRRRMRMMEISGGERARPRQWPWVVRLVGGCPGGVCGGALVSPRIVLTAYHCANSIYSDSIELCDHSDGERKAILGRTGIDMKKKDSYYMIPVIEARAPPNGWLSYGNYKTHDFALLILQKPAVYNCWVQPICLPPPDFDYTGNKSAVAAGWGRTDSISTKQSKTLKYVWLKVNPRKYNHTFMFGTFLSKRDGVYQDPCSGDSGGPLMYLNENNSRFSLIGTVNGNGYDCRTGSFNTFEEQTDGMWNKVSEHMEWIKKTMTEFEQPICIV